MPPRVTQTAMTNDYGHYADYRNTEDCSGILEATRQLPITTVLLVYKFKF